MSNFWQDDDDEEPLSQSIFQSSQQQGEFVSASQNTFRCHYCDSTDSYVDETTDREVCANCHTESQPSQSQAMDYEEVVGLAAKTHGSIRLLKRPKIKTQYRDYQGGSYNQQQQRDYSEYDQSQPLPDLETCLIGFQTVLYHAMERLLELLDWKQDKTRRKQAHTLLRTLWADYLAAWKEGAEKYAKLYPHVRFALRDAFLCHVVHRTMIHKTLSYHALKRVREEMEQASNLVKTEEQNVNDQKVAASSNASRKKSVLSSQSADNDDDTNASEDTSGASSDDSESDDNDENAEDDDNDGVDAPQRKTFGRSKIAQVVFRHTHRKTKTHADVALQQTCTPSMPMAAALLWLTVYRSGVTSSQICHWLKTGSLPLQNAYMLLDKEQQRVLRPIKYFFVLRRPLSITALEHAATHLATACRLKETPELLICDPRKKTVLRFITAKSVPRVLAQMVADMGMSQAVLDRCLILLGLLPLEQGGAGAGAAADDEATRLMDDGDQDYFSERTGPPLSPEQISRLEDAAALIAIACFMDPDWRKWRYSRPYDMRTKDRSVPGNPEQLHWLGNGPSLKSYVDFLEEVVLCETDSYAPAFADLLRQTNTRVGRSETTAAATCGSADAKPQVRPYPFVAGVPLKGGVVSDAACQPVDPQKKLLIEFIAHSIGVPAFQVETQVTRMIC